MSTTDDRFQPFAERMRAEGLPEVVIRSFEREYAALAAGQRGMIPEADITPAEGVQDAEALPAALDERGREALGRTVVIKLNGGLGTTMGLERAKSLLPVRDGMTFLEIIARSCATQGVPLVLMNSFATRDDSLAALEGVAPAHPELPQDFVQHKVPKVRRDDLSPAAWPANPALEWCPPGHGDLYPSLVSSGLLERLIAGGYEFAFVSNADNLGAVVDVRILGYLVRDAVPFLMEVADRTPADSKGGHLAQRPDGQLLLRESAQCPDADKGAFGDIARHRYFNTNNLWLRLPDLQALLEQRDGVLGLPSIVNPKTVDPRDPTSPAVYQLETAMGAAIEVIPGARALRVDRARFSPVKSSSDLLAVRSDAYVLTDDFRVVVNPARTRGPLHVSLDPAFYQRIDQLDERFPQGAPSLIDCDRLTVVGDVRFGRGVTLVGDVTLVNESADPRRIGDGEVIRG